jgi:hypothetical protein
VKTVAFPEVSKFSDLFGNIEPKQNREFADKAVISNWLLYSDHHSEYRAPTEKTLEYVRNNMLPVDYDSIYFRVIDRGDNETLIVAQYNQIIGSRWLAFIKTDSVPR